MSHQLNVKTGPADVPDHGRRFWKWLGGGVPGSNQHNPTECDSDGFEPANLLHLDPAATSPSCHKSLRQQGKVGRDQVLHHHPSFYSTTPHCLSKRPSYLSSRPSSRFSLPANVFISGLEASHSSQSVDTSLLGSAR